jgi:hypothetical protein
MSGGGFAVRQEADVVPGARLVRIGVAGVVVGLVGIVVAAVLLVASDGSVAPSFANPGGAPVSPRRISNVEQTPIGATHDGQELQAAQLRELQTWSWVDRDAGIVRVPIDRAIDLVVERSR